MKVPGVISLSERIAVAPSTTVEIPLKLNKGKKGPGDQVHAHVVDLLVVCKGVTVANATADANLDAAFWAGIISQITLNASADSPFGTRRGGQLISPMSMYLALLGLSGMSDAPVMAYGADSLRRFQNSGAAADTNSLTSGAKATTRRFLRGLMHKQGPFGNAKVGAAVLTTGTVIFNLAIGRRHGESDGLNPIPLAWLNGGGCACNSTFPSKSEGTITVTIPATVGGLALSAFASIQVFARVVYSDKLNSSCLQPVLNSYNSTDETVAIQPTIHGLTCLAEDLTAGGAMQLTNVSGVTQYKLLCGGVEPYESQFAECRAAWVAGNLYHPCATDDFAGVDPSSDSGYSGPEALQRYDWPFFTIIHNPGPVADDPAYFNGRAQPVSFQLVNSSTAVNRRVLVAGWLPQDSAYLHAAVEYSGAPQEPKSPIPTLALSQGMPGKAALAASAPSPKTYAAN